MFYGLHQMLQLYLHLHTTQTARGRYANAVAFILGCDAFRFQFLLLLARKVYEWFVIESLVTFHLVLVGYLLPALQRQGLAYSPSAVLYGTTYLQLHVFEENLRSNLAPLLPWSQDLRSRR